MVLQQQQLASLDARAHALEHACPPWSSCHEIVDVTITPRIEVLMYLRQSDSDGLRSDWLRSPTAVTAPVTTSSSFSSSLPPQSTLLLPVRLTRSAQQQAGGPATH